MSRVLYIKANTKKEGESRARIADSFINIQELSSKR